MFGFLNLHKPAACTSRDVVNQVQRLVRPEKVGHAGTLDPLATGVLIVAVGGATRLVEYVQQQRKSYRATFLLGRQSDTEDSDGQVVEVINPPLPTESELHAALPMFLGEIDQVPPAYSALKIAGRRAYALARQGADVQLAARKITIHELTLLHYDYPTLELEIACSSGTYVRSLGRDLARAMGTQAVMSALVRTSIGPFRLDNAISPDSLTRENLSHHLLPARAAVAHLPTVPVDHGEVTELLHGRPLLRAGTFNSPELAALDPAGELIAILEFRAGKLWPNRVFATQ